jgi:glycosyltransferase involved in cell wall biosynthesis
VASAFGINLIASVSGDAGLGVAARLVARSLQRHGVPFKIFDAPVLWGAPVRYEGIDAPVVTDLDQLDHPVNLYILPLMTWETLIGNNPGFLGRGRFHAAWIWWESSAVPPSWAARLSGLDVAIAGSSFIANVVAGSLMLTPVIEALHPLPVFPPVAPARERFGLPADATVFVLSFDPNGDPLRKNPFGAIEAFRMAFPAEEKGVCLAIRVNHANTEIGELTLKEMARFAQGDPRIRFLVEPMGYEEVLSLYASGDVYVSLHRGEGLGLGLMEAMALGKPVIATAWSGNMSFMDATCGALVRYRTAPVKGVFHFFKPEFAGSGTYWAEPLLNDAAAWMQRLHSNRAEREAMGRAAKVAIERHQARSNGREWIDQLEAMWRAREFLPPLPGKFSGVP